METLVDQFSRSWENLAKKLGSWIDALITGIPNLVLALLIVLIGLGLTQLVRRWAEKALNRLLSNVAIAGLIANAIAAVFVGIIIFVAVGVLNLDTVLASLLAGAGVAGLAIGLALQEPLINIFSGVLLSVRQHYRVGDLIETNDIFGVVQDMKLRTTMIKTLDGQEIVLPNKNIIQNPLKNYTSSGERRVELNCGISYAEDLEKVRSIAVQAVEQEVKYNTDREVEFFYLAFNDSSIDFLVRFWIKDGRQAAFLQARSEAILALKKAFDNNDITIPFPIRTLDFGIKGGERLREVLRAED